MVNEGVEAGRQARVRLTDPLGGLPGDVVARAERALDLFYSEPNNGGGGGVRLVFAEAGGR